MKQLLLSIKVFIFFLFISFYSIAQNSWWTWMTGANTTSQTGVYGTMGVPAATNTPGARVNAANWTDANGNLWLFGGDLASGKINDLWKYNPATNQWTWEKGDNTINQNGVYGIKGVAAASNKPGSRDRLTFWSDSNGDLWIFGGFGKTTNSALPAFGGYLNDVWKYNITTNQWTWVTGDTAYNTIDKYDTILGTYSTVNMPGGRTYAGAWVDTAGILWMFGGLGMKGYLNDLWKYNPTTNQWAWVKGDTIGGVKGIYGTLGVADSLNKPGSRAGGAYWYDENNHCLWMFGGWGYDKNGGSTVLNDLWKYDITANKWTWVGGADINSQPGVYGTLGIGATTNIPGARSSMGYFKDTATGNLFLYSGGTGVHRFNDLWRYNISTNEWTWVNGNNGPNQLANYGTQGVPAPTNIPGARYGAQMWYDQSGDLWLFGGNGFATTSNAAFLNDLWKLDDYITTNIDEQVQNTLQLYPNPNNGTFVIKLNKVSEKSVVEIYNQLGQVVLTKQLQSNETIIDASQLPKGVYVIRLLEIGQLVTVSKVVVQ